MPVYEYGCNACQSRIEVMQRFSDPPLTTCEQCGGPLKKLISNTSFVLKGSGWYITDYARKDKGEASGDKESGGAGGDKKEGAEKPASASDSGKSSSEGDGKTSTEGGSSSSSAGSSSSSSSSSTPGTATPAA